MGVTYKVEFYKDCNFDKNKSVLGHSWVPFAMLALLREAISDGRARESASRSFEGADDNAAMESFFALLQRNVLDRQRWRTGEELRLAMVTWIERTYHRRRRQRRLRRLTRSSSESEAR